MSIKASNAQKPSEWFSDVDPFVVLRYYVKEDVANEQIQTVLNKHAITKIAQLEPIRVDLLPLLPNNIYYEFFSTLGRVSDRIRKTAEACLGGQLDYQDSHLSKLGFKTYTEGAVSIRPTRVSSPGFTFSLVMGPSGSGKTLFSIRGLWRLVFPAATNEAEIYRIHISARDPERLIEDEKNLTYPEAVANIVRKPVARRLSDGGAGDAKVIQLYLHVIIDEAGTLQYKDHFDTAAKIRAIVTALDEKMPFRFAKGVHVTVAGVGLERATAEIDSVTETTKFRMQSWGLQHFDALVDMSSHPDRDMVKDVVREYPVFQASLSNGRCALSLLCDIEEVLSNHKDKIKSFVNSIVCSVTRSYINSNMLSSLTRYANDDKWVVTRAAFREVDRATSQPNVAFFPQLDGTELKQFSACCVLDVNVESRGGQPVLMAGDAYSVSMQPALMIAMAALVHSDDFEVSWDWLSYESVVIPMELKRLAQVWTTDAPGYYHKSVIEMRHPLLVDRSKSSFTIPVVSKFHVVRNSGPNAPYANVIAPYRLIRAKFSEDATKAQPLDLAMELNMMGLTSGSGYNAQKAVTSALYNMWDCQKKVPSPATITMALSADRKRRLENHLMSSLNPSWNVQEPAMITYSAKKSGHVWTAKGDAKNKIKTLVAFKAEQPVTAVFVTNCRAFEWKRESGKETVVINQTDVDWKGQLHHDKKLPEDVLLRLREHVEVRFIFV